MAPASVRPLATAFFALAALSLPHGLHAQSTATNPPHKSVGVALQRQGDDPLEVTEVRKGSPAEKAGLQVGDQIVTVSGVSADLLDPDQMRAIADTAKVVPFVVMRTGKKMTLNVEPAYMPGPAPATRVETHTEPR